MKIGLVMSGYEMMPLMQVLNQYDCEYHLFVDRKFRPIGDKSLELQQERLDIALEYLDDKVDVVIVSPLRESKVESRKSKVPVLPLFETYMLEYVLKYSIVGKLGVLVESGKSKVEGDVESLMHDIIKKYSLTDNQKNIKKFNQKFPLWTKCVRMWNYFLTTYGRRDRMVRNTIKHDLRYFHDAGVDTLVPMSWGFLFYQKIIKTRINWKKMRFHGLDVVGDCFEKCIGSLHPHPSPLPTATLGEGVRKDVAGGYSVMLHCTDRPVPLLEEKKWMQVLSRGGEVEVKEVVV